VTIPHARTAQGADTRANPGRIRASSDQRSPSAPLEEVGRICVLDYGMGNLRSVEKAFERVGAEVTITSDPDRAARADGLVLPGVGAFPRAMERIGELRLDRLIRERLEEGTPLLGICLGFELLFERSDELGGARGLGLLGGDVSRLDAPGRKLPHVGWEPVRWRAQSELTAGIADGAPFYFVHGFAPRPGDLDVVLGVAAHGTHFVCAVARPPLYGCQFHPEKSSAAGLRLLSNFSRICATNTSRLNSGGARLRPPDSADTSRLNSGGARLRPPDSASQPP
jgi:imidazole glycerol-phosphate synthase subunit HisH